MLFETLIKCMPLYCNIFTYMIFTNICTSAICNCSYPIPFCSPLQIIPPRILSHQQGIHLAVVELLATLVLAEVHIGKQS